MWWVFLFCIVFSSPSFSQVRINEIYYDHPGRDDGYEFVELFNVDSLLHIELDGYTLEFHDGNATGWVTVWRASAQDLIEAHGLFVIGGENVIPAPDVIERLNLQNGPDAVRLLVGGIEIDRVGYGELDGDDFYEQESAPDVDEGHSLGRKPDGRDTNHNANDFHADVPSPGTRNVPRRDVALTVHPDTPPRRALLVPATENVWLRITNSGLDPVSANSVIVEVADSMGGLTTTLGSTSNPDDIPPAGVADVVIPIVLQNGYHRLTVTASLVGDERPGNNTLVLLRRGGRPELLISEVLSNPATGVPEFVELFNAGSDAIDLKRFFIRDASHAPALVTETTVVAVPGAYVVLTSDREALVRHFQLSADNVVEIVGGWPSLNHTGKGVADSVIVLDAFELPVESVAYPPQPTDSKGLSLERVDLFHHENHSTWVLSSDNRGATPGSQNSVTVPELPQAGITVHPNPFTLGSENLLITVAHDPTVNRVVVRSFDINGRSIRDVGTTTTLPFVFVWDGADDNGRAVPPGLYLIACEFQTSGARRVEKVVVGCAEQN